MTPTEAEVPATAPKRPSGAVAFFPLGEGDGQDRERRRRQEGGAEPLEGAGADQDLGRLRQAGEQRGAGEDASPARKMRRRPSRSPSRPPSRRKPPRNSP